MPTTVTFLANHQQCLVRLRLEALVSYFSLSGISHNARPVLPVRNTTLIEMMGQSQFTQMGALFLQLPESHMSHMSSTCDHGPAPAPPQIGGLAVGE